MYYREFNDKLLKGAKRLLRKEKKEVKAACGSLLGGNFHTSDFGAGWISFKDFFRKNRFGCTGHPMLKYPGKLGIFKGKMLLVEDKR